MATIEPVKQDVINPGKVKRNSFNIRLWHWLNVIIISGSLLTVLLNSTILSRKPTTTIITEQLTKAGVTNNTTAAAQQAAHELNEKVWTIHGYIGLILVTLLLYRLIIELIQPQKQKFFKRLSVARLKLHDAGTERYLARHEYTVKLIYLGFYLLLCLIAITGLSLFFEEQLSLSKTFAHQVKEVHGFFMYLVLLFIVVHIVGVLLAEKKQSPGIISDMVNGGGEEA